MTKLPPPEPDAGAVGSWAQAVPPLKKAAKKKPAHRWIMRMPGHSLPSLGPGSALRTNTIARRGFLNYHDGGLEGINRLRKSIVHSRKAFARRWAPPDHHCFPALFENESLECRGVYGAGDGRQGAANQPRMKTSAVVFEAPNQVVFREVTIPDPGPKDVVVDTVSSWISPGTELSTLRGDRIYGDTSAGLDTPFSFPRVSGYQKIGRVVSVGEQAGSLRVGQMVFATIGRVEGMFEEWGGHLARSVCPSDQVFALPEGSDPELFSGAVLTQVGFNAGNRAPLKSGDLAVVLGDGLVGLWTAQTLQHRGARVWLVGRHEDRLARFVLMPGDRAIKLEPRSAARNAGRPTHRADHDSG